MLIVKNRMDLLRLVIRDGMVGAELGVFIGKFSEDMLNAFKLKTLYMVDTFTGLQTSGLDGGLNVVSANMPEEYERLSFKYREHQTAKIVKSTTHDFLEQIGDGVLDFVYIDADHRYPAVKRDLELSHQKVKPGGIIMGHDYHLQQFPGVVAAVDEICMDNGLSIFALTECPLPSFAIVKPSLK